MCLFSFLHCDPDVKIFSLALRHGTQLVVMAVTTRPFFFKPWIGGIGATFHGCVCIASGVLALKFHHIVGF